MSSSDIICAISTAFGRGAIAVIRVSGKGCISAIAHLFDKKTEWVELEANRAKFISIYEGEKLIDQVVVTKFLAPHSYCGEDMLEISCHGSVYVQQKIIELLLQAGCRLANPGEFTMRAFLNGKMDLPQAEAIADLIDSQTEVAHRIAVNQMKGSFTSRLHTLRTQLIDLASLLELELDFSEEDVQFADRTQLRRIVEAIKTEVAFLLDSFKWGNVLKDGIPVAIIGKPNVGKSTLLNCLVEDDRAIISHIPGTTRDTIEDTFILKGYPFRFIDTAGLRATDDEIENFGIERTYKAVDKASVILYLIDISETNIEEVETELHLLEENIQIANKKVMIIANKIDQLSEMPHSFGRWNDLDIYYISAKRKVNIETICTSLLEFVQARPVTDGVLLTNTRHYDVMLQLQKEIASVEDSFAHQTSSEIIASQIRQALYHIGTITGEIATDEILNNIFGKFCIGK
ncbi:MAG: tRNA uridine-5-carboxymethylaminomethyl(34) synthesis GTPase MnmE [Bacteroidales bacterium]|jgi:tRNA modification GTPase|nr:tRNA uridine-5-carboxymethylaminomethyl(34) synthesis GTPase MnmE [Bacteroidales bacterium]